MRIDRSRCIILVISAFALLFLPRHARAWGCKGHQTIALIAERYLSPEARDMVEKLLHENPAEPETGRYCGGPDFGPLASASTWADDIRRQRPETAPWHYINIPRGAIRHSLQEYCGEGACINQSHYRTAGDFER